MKKIIFSLLLAAAVSSVFAAKALVVTQKMVNANDAMKHVTITWYITETQCKMKMEFNDGKVNTVTWFIPDMATASLLTYTEGAVPAGTQKAYFSIPAQSVKAPADMNASRLTVKRTGETKNISGIACEKIIVRTNANTTEMWVTVDFVTDYYKYYTFFQSSYELMGLNEEKIQGFPLQSSTTDNSGKEVAALQLVSVTVTELKDTDFQVPAEYKSAEAIKAGK